MSGGNSKQHFVALRKVKADIERVTVESTNIAVYEFDSAQTKWNRLGVEGGAFIVQTSSEPKWHLIVLNRAGPENFVLDLASIIKVKLQPPYLMLRCATEAAPCIYGLWFHENAERETFALEMETCLRQSKLAKIPVRVQQISEVLTEVKCSEPKNPILADVILKPGSWAGDTNATTIQVHAEACGDNVSAVVRISEVSSRLLSPSDITGIARNFIKTRP